jgi:uracil-DNA glycosylase
VPRPDPLRRHVEALRACRLCPGVVPPPAVADPPRRARVLLVGQAPGPREQASGRLFAYTAGTRLFSWLSSIGVGEAEFRARVWMSAVIRCFPGRAPQGGDRVPAPEEIANCGPWLERELDLLRPSTVIAVGSLAMRHFLPPAPLAERVGRRFRLERDGGAFELVPLPHPSGRSTWTNHPENAKRLRRALALLADSPGWRETFG